MATYAYAEACSGMATRAAESSVAAVKVVHDVKGNVLLNCTSALLSLDGDAHQQDQCFKELAVAVAATGCLDGIVCAMRASPRLREAAAAHSEMKSVLAIAAMRSGDPTLAELSATALKDTKINTPLSRREREVLQLVAEGFRNDQIARQLFISPFTVKTHLQNIYAKLDVRSRTEAAMKAREAGLLR